MNHRSSINRLGRTSAHRKALLKSMTKALFKYERIRTTSAKAKEARELNTKVSTIWKSADGGRSWRDSV